MSSPPQAPKNMKLKIYFIQKIIFRESPPSSLAFPTPFPLPPPPLIPHPTLDFPKIYCESTLCPKSPTLDFPKNRVSRNEKKHWWSPYKMNVFPTSGIAFWTINHAGKDSRLKRQIPIMALRCKAVIDVSSLFYFGEGEKHTISWDFSLICEGREGQGETVIFAEGGWKTPMKAALAQIDEQPRGPGSEQLFDPNNSDCILKSIFSLPEIEKGSREMKVWF